ncbi:MAG: hypothetical protein EB110_00275, partial [Betaproteobacteria bacterium]|nr:hypothetical protein [Betaproteobacteria bacterium]
LVGSDAVASVTQSAVGVTSTAVAQAGTFSVRPSNAVLSTGTLANYDFTYVDSAYTVNKANLAVNATASLTGNVYNGNPFVGTYTSTALGSDASAMTVTGQASGTNAGTYTSNLAVTGAVLANWSTPMPIWW